MKNMELKGSKLIFRDRKEAGQQLANSLEKYRDKNPFILGIPRGGVVVAYQVAKALKAQLDVIVARKLGAPPQPEFAIGAIAPNGIRVLNAESVHYFGLSEQDIESLVTRQQREMERRIQLYRSGREDLNVKDRIVIVIDDGLATGLTAIAAVRSVKKSGAKQIILAVPVCAADTFCNMQQEADEVICLSVPEYFDAVGRFYQDFPQTTDDEVIALLKKSISH
jgi:putative phosphoribosyl transferase